MKLENLDKAVELKILLDTTYKASVEIEKLLILPESKDKKSYNDGPYNLSISEHNDGSGKRIELARYYGNRDLLKVIKTELLRQVEFLRKEIELL